MNAGKVVVGLAGLAGLAWVLALVKALWELNKADDWEVGSW